MSTYDSQLLKSQEQIVTIHGYNVQDTNKYMCKYLALKLWQKLINIHGLFVYVYVYIRCFQMYACGT